MTVTEDKAIQAMLDKATKIIRDQVTSAGLEADMELLVTPTAPAEYITLNFVLDEMPPHGLTPEEQGMHL